MIGYCRYLLEKKPNNMTLAWIGAESLYKNEFLDSYQELLNEFKKKFRIKDEKFNDDKITISVLCRFTNSKTIFFKRKPDEKLLSLYHYTKNTLKDQSEKLKTEARIDYDVIFNITNNILILMTNSVICNNKKEVIYSTLDINIESIVHVLCRAYDLIIEKENEKRNKKQMNFLKLHKIHKKEKMSLIKIRNEDKNAKIIIESIGNIKSENAKYMIQYFIYMLLATHTQNEEIKGDFGNVW